MPRRSLLALGSAIPVALALVACEPESPDPTPTGPSVPAAERRESAEGVAAARALLADAERELNAAFPGLAWRDGDPERCSPEAGGSVFSPAARHCSRYLGNEEGEDTLIAKALTAALATHGLPAAPAPHGSTGGWLVTESEGHGLRLEFQSKGYAEIRVEAHVRGGCGTVSDGG